MESRLLEERDILNFPRFPPPSILVHTKKRKLKTNVLNQCLWLYAIYCTILTTVLVRYSWNEQSGNHYDLVKLY